MLSDDHLQTKEAEEGAYDWLANSPLVNSKILPRFLPKFLGKAREYSRRFEKMLKNDLDNFGEKSMKRRSLKRNLALLRGFEK